MECTVVGARHRFTGFQKVLDSKMGKGYRWPTAVGAAHNAVKNLSGKFHIRSLLGIRTLESCRSTTKGKEQSSMPGMVEWQKSPRLIENSSLRMTG